MATIKDRFSDLIKNLEEYELLESFKTSITYISMKHSCGLIFRTRPKDFVDGHRCSCELQNELRTTKASCERCNSEFFISEEELKQDRTWCSLFCKNLMHESKCSTCGKTIYGKNKKSFCSVECRKKICPGCGKMFIFKNKHYCSDECYIKTHTFTCKGCGEKFFDKVKKRTYCTTSCRTASHSLKDNTFICKHCKTPFTTKRFLENFCSDECRLNFNPRKLPLKRDKHFKSSLYDIVSFKVIQLIEGRRKAIMDLNNRVDYRLISGFTKKLKEEILDRDNKRCFICECETKLEVHHIVPRRLGGAHVNNNFITLCTPCHRHIETGNEEYAIKKCVINAEKYYQIYSIPLDEYDKSLAKPKLEQAINNLNILYDKIIETDLEEDMLMNFSDVIDELGNVSRLIKK